MKKNVSLESCVFALASLQPAYFLAASESDALATSGCEVVAVLNVVNKIISSFNSMAYGKL
ncbi:hypothetical protein QUF54_10770 [Candidatus Marithioploca araucensis]|uniref:Uncharacterized protein n=1 Tax=Candidatus Marithioploca araucensis TaxID=70273 RepID=A0ABT7VW72_9GAMM|nr:hypothetical protein [Candidatus Marithioploca araucensis]